MPAIIRPYYLFGHGGKPAGGMRDFLGSHFSPDEAVAYLAGHPEVKHWQLAVYGDESLVVIDSSEKAAKASSKKE